MEIVSNKLSLSATNTPQGSLRTLERKETFTQQRKWNASANANTQQRSSHRRRESLTGGSLMSLKAYYRKLRTFKGTIKALISFRRLPTFASRTASATMSSAAITEHAAEDSATKIADTEPLKVAETVVKLTDDENALQTVQNQVKDLVEKGHVVTELNGVSKEGVTYRMQGNLEHYTEENLRKRLRLQEHPHMVALTQRLWLSAVHEQEDHLSFGEYEAYMLRLHRLILPEFDLAQSRELIKDDWARDTDGSDALDYRFFHFSMFELVDLWTDTVEAEDYISLLYCIMHSLTFEWNGRHLLKALEDINPIDIMEASKDMTMEEIERDLSREVNSEDAQMYRDRIASDEDGNGVITEGCEEGAQEDSDAAEAKAPLSPERLDTNADTPKPDELPKPAPMTRKASRGPNTTPAAASPDSQQQEKKLDSAEVASPRSTSAVKSPAQRRTSSREDAKSATRRPPPIRTSSVPADHAIASTTLRPDVNTTPVVARPDEVLSREASGTSRTTEPSSGMTDTDRDRMASNFNLQASGSRGGGRTSVAYTGPRVVLSPNGGNQYSSEGSSEAPPINIMSLGSGGDFINMVSKPTYIRRPSALTSGLSPRQQGGYPGAGGDQSIWGQALLANSGRNSPTHGLMGPVQANDYDISGYPTLPHSPILTGGHGYPTGRSTFVSPRSPQSPRAVLKESETRQGSLLINGEQQRHGSTPIVYGNLSPRARSAKSQARFSTQLSGQSHMPLYIGSDRPSVSGVGVTPFSSLSLDMAPLKSGGQDTGPLMVGGGLQSSRMSILARPATSSPTSPRAVPVGTANGLDGFLQAKAYQDVLPSSPTRPASRGSRAYSPSRGSHLQTENDLAVVSTGVQSPRPAPHNRSTIVHFMSPHQQQQGAFFGSVVGSNTLEATSHKSQTPRSSVGQLPTGSARRVIPGNRVSTDLGLSGAPARLSIHKDAPPRATRPASKRAIGGAS